MTGTKTRLSQWIDKVPMVFGFALFSALALCCGCAAPVRAYRVRLVSIKTDIIVYETQAQVSRQCQKHIRRWENATGKTQMLDNGQPAAMGQEYRGCMVPPARPEGYKHVLTSLETIDNGVHEICHALGEKAEVCDSIHFDGRYYPGRTVEVGGE